MSLRSDMTQQIGALLDHPADIEQAIWQLSRIELARLTPESLAGAVDAVMARAMPFPEHPDAIDVCGTGGDGRQTFNISTAAAFVVAARGVPVAKHGNRAISSAAGSIDVLEALGVNTKLTPAESERMFGRLGIVFLFAPLFHPAVAQLAPARKQIGQRTIFNLLGPLTNPARVTRQMIGVFAPEYCSLLAETAALLERRKVLVVHGDDGTDEISVTTLTHTAVLEDGALSYASLRPQDAGVAPQSGRALVGGDAHRNAKALTAVLLGEPGAYAEAVAINAGAALMVAGAARTIEEGVTLARSTMARGDAARLLASVIAFGEEPDA